jgi:hypothetical protein
VESRRPETAAIQSGAGAVKHAAANPQLELLERLGYAVRGVLYVVMGFLALRIAAAQPGGKATNLSGSLLWLIGNPFGKLVLIVVVIGLAAYSMWGFIRAIYDPLHRGRNTKGIAARIGFLTSAFSYAAIVFFGLQILAGQGASSHDSTQKTVSSLLTNPAGGFITIALGIIAIGIGIGQFVEAYRATFRHDLKSGEMSKSERDIAIGLGRFGMAARGVTFLVIGFFLVQAGINHDPGKATGFGGAFLFLLSQPYGHLLVGIIALGFIALGLHSFACARWVKLLGSSAG